MSSVSIVIPNYNYGRFADPFFNAIHEQSMGLDGVEIIFVDDGSDDDSIAQAQAWAQRIKCRHFAIETPVRTGKPGLVRNHGLSKASGEYLLCLDPDDSIHPDFLKKCTEALDTTPRIDLVYTDYQEIHPDKTITMRLPAYNPAQLRTQNPLSPTAMYRRTLWDKGVRYRDNTTYEDWDYWIQCAAVGGKFMRLDEKLYNYRIHDSNYSIQAIEQDGPAKAQIVLNNPDFFHPLVTEWATDYFRGRLLSQSLSRGYIPGPEDVRKLLKMVEDKTLSHDA